MANDPGEKPRQPQCKHVDYEPVRWGVELPGLMIGGASPCHNDAAPGHRYCQLHLEDEKRDA